MNKIALITGATSGIGKACAWSFAKAKYNLIITGRRKERLDILRSEIEKECNIKCLTLSFDVRNREEVDRQIETIPEEWRMIDVLINNAGLAVGLNSLQDGNWEDWERMIDTNIKGILWVTRKILPWLILQKKGHIINISSIAGKEVYPNGNVYCATKHAVDALSKGLRMDVLPYGIKVTNIGPGAVETEFSLVRFKGDESKAKTVYSGYKALSGEDIAEIVLFTASLPPHVEIHDLLVTPTAQASASLIYKQNH